ncbi:hypothetical protein [Pelagibius sp.]|uniref:hypothetical protein n=1 Tax=Pelagibius sp. TaxID=1931238 RepID=UPI002626397E|nr:hypothetical protein [Pelagibius sp.]
MSSIQPSFESRPFGHHAEFDTTDGGPKALGRRIRWSVAVAALLALGLLAVVNLNTAPVAGTGSVAEQPQGAHSAPFDGRGKWTGYAR